jgi:hypothetical protein
MGFLADGSIGLSADGFRATASTMLNESGFRSDVIEWQLAHQERSNLRASHNHATKAGTPGLRGTLWQKEMKPLKTASNTAPKISLQMTMLTQRSVKQSFGWPFSINQIVEQRKLTQSQGGQCVGPSSGERVVAIAL